MYYFVANFFLAQSNIFCSFYFVEDQKYCNNSNTWDDLAILHLVKYKRRRANLLPVSYLNPGSRGFIETIFSLS